MKKSTIKSQEAINMKANLVTVSLDVLRNTGRAFGGIRFRIGDIITFPDWDDVEMFQDSFVGKDKQEHTFPVIKVGFNESVRVIPVASFRRETQGIDEYIEKYTQLNTFLRDINLATDDFERMKLFAGHTIKVAELFEARNVAFIDGARVPYNKDDVKTFTTSRWPVFVPIDTE